MWARAAQVSGMTEIASSALFSALFVGLETAGSLYTKWRVAIRLARPEAELERARVALGFDKAKVPPGQDPQALLAAEMNRAHDEVVRKHVSRALGSIMPGPEVCFLAFTIQVALLLAANTADPETLKAILPAIAASNLNYSLLLGLVFLSLALWLLTSYWRDMISEGLQTKGRGPSIFLIMVLAGGALAPCFYFVVAGR